MPHAAILRHLRSLAARPMIDRTDRELLRGFAALRDEAAFAAMVRRHGPLVLSVCRRVLRHEQDAEDAFQATFLVLARKATSIQNSDTVGGWLFGVAYRTAMCMRKRAARQRERDQRAALGTPTEPIADASLHELQALLDAEVARLPEKLRLPFVACCLEGRSKAEAARDLGWKEGTVSSRLALARERLRDRLTRRGVTLSAALTALALEQQAAAAVPSALAIATVRGALEPQSVSGNVGAAARASLTAGLRFKWAVTVVLVTGLLAAVAALGEWLAGGEAQSSSPLAPAPSSLLPQEQGQPKTDQDGNPLPAGALLRLGSLRLRHRDTVRSVAFTPDGKLLATAGWGRTIPLWDPATGKEVSQIDGPTKGVNCIAISSDGKLLAGAGLDHIIYLWDAATGKEVRRLESGADAEQSQLNVVAFSSKGDRLVWADPKAVRLWDVASGKPLHVFTMDNAVCAATFSPDGRTVAAGGGDNTVRIWDVENGQQLHHLKGHDAYIQGLVFAKDGKTLVTTSGQGAAVLWDTTTGQRIKPPAGTDYRGNIAAFSPDGTILALAGVDRIIRLFDWKTGKELRKLRGRSDHAVALVFSPDGATLACASAESAIHLWEVATGKPRLVSPGHTERVVSVAYSSDGRTIATAAWDGAVCLWNAGTGAEVRRLQADGSEKPPQFPIDAAELSRVTFSPDGKRLAVVRGDKDVPVWDLATGKLIHRFHAECIAFSPDGKLIACGGHSFNAANQSEGVIILYDATSGKVLRELRWHLTTVASVVFSSDSKMLYSRGYVLFGLRTGEPGESETKFVRAWDVATAKEIRAFPGNQQVNGITVSPDGRTLVSFDMIGKTLTLYETATGGKRIELNGHTEMIFGAAFAPDGRTLATASMDGTVRLWDLPSGKEIARLEGHRGWVLSVAFSPDGTRVASSSIDTTALVWDMSRLMKRPTKPVVLSAKALESCWADLAGDATKGYRAIASLNVAPTQAASLLRDRLHPAAAPDQRRVARLIADLDSDEFAVRQKAAAELEQVAELAEPTLRKALNDTASAESKRRIEALLAKLDSGDLPAAALRDLRALEVLEQLATPEVRQLLQDLAKGLPHARLTLEAKATLERQGRRANRSP
jgi:RNA polymerase sigma factor (sigma-70 family)